MVGKTSLFTILTGVHEAARVGTAGSARGRHQGSRRRAWTRWPSFSSRRRSRTPPSNISISRRSPKKPCATRAIWRACAWWTRWRTCCACFESDTVPHEKGSVDPMRDFEDVEIELILSDLVVVEKRMERLDKDRKKIKSPELDQEFALLERLKAELEANRSVARSGVHAGRRKAHPRLPVSVAEADAVRAEPGRGRRRAAARSRRAVSHRPVGRPSRTPR